MQSHPVSLLVEAGCQRQDCIVVYRTSNPCCWEVHVKRHGVGSELSHTPVVRVAVCRVSREAVTKRAVAARGR